VLELGCGDGGNLPSMAQTLPGSSFLGIDASEAAIARGDTLARAAALENSELLCCGFESLPGDLGHFDYIVSHGVYSWITPRARVALLAAMRRHLAPDGVAFVSYNAYPGSYLRDMAKDILAYHVSDIEDPQQRLSRAQILMGVIVAIEEPSPYAQVLREHMERMLRYPDALLFHDDLAEISTPFYFHEFMEHATRHQLAFLSESDLFESQMRDVPESATQLMAELADDVIAREQYLDFFKNRMFRQTLLCHDDAPVTRELDDRHLEHMTFSSDSCSQEANEAQIKLTLTAQSPPAETFITPQGFSMRTSEPLVRAVMHSLAQAWPAAIDFTELLLTASQAAGPDASRHLVADRLRAVMLAAYLARVITIWGCSPPLLNRPSERPLASPLARAQLASGLSAVSSLRHTNVRLDGELEPRLLALLDGARDRADLLADLTGVPDKASLTPERVDGALERFASLGLLAS
jgi:SAM-dependent methyltransferase